MSQTNQQTRYFQIFYLYCFIKVKCLYIYLVNISNLAARSSNKYNYFFEIDNIGFEQIPMLLRELIGFEFATYILQKLKEKNRELLFFGLISYWYNFLKENSNYAPEIVQGAIAIFMLDDMELCLIDEYFEDLINEEL
jgi:hypothetical protein